MPVEEFLALLTLVFGATNPGPLADGITSTREKFSYPLRGFCARCAPPLCLSRSQIHGPVYVYGHMTPCADRYGVKMSQNGSLPALTASTVKHIC